MGAGASTAETSDFVRKQGNAYAPYADSIVDNGVDGALVADIMAGEGADVEDALTDLGITNKLHIRKIMLGVRAQFSASATARRGTPGTPSSASVVAVTEAAAEAAKGADVFVSHAKRIDTTEDRASWCADVLELHGLVSFFDRTDLKEITEEALREKVLSSKVRRSRGIRERGTRTCSPSSAFAWRSSSLSLRSSSLPSTP